MEIFSVSEVYRRTAFSVENTQRLIERYIRSQRSTDNGSQIQLHTNISLYKTTAFRRVEALTSLIITNNFTDFPSTAALYTMHSFTCYILSFPPDGSIAFQTNNLLGY